MNVNDILNLTPDELGKMNRQQLADVTTILGSAINKRVNRIEEKASKNPTEQIVSPAMRGLMDTGGKISVKGKNLNEIRHEFKRARHFLTLKTATQKGFQSFRKETFDRIGGAKMTIGEERQFWHVYNKLVELDPTAIEMYGSAQLQQMLRSMQMYGDTEEDMAQNALDRITEAYEEAQIDRDNDDFGEWYNSDLIIHGNNSEMFNSMSAGQIGAALNRGDTNVLSERHVYKHPKKGK